MIFLLALLSGSCQTGPGLKQEEKTAEAEAVTRIEALGGEVERDAALSEMTSIDELQLSGTSISDEGLEHLQGLSRLVGLHVRGTGVTESGLERLKQAISGLIIHQWQPGT